MMAHMPEIKQLTKPTPRKRKYMEGPLLNQGNTPQCVGYSGLGFLNAAPLTGKQGKDSGPGRDPEGIRLYKGAQDNDEWVGTNYDGSSVRGLMKYMQRTGEIGSYVWGQTVVESTEWMNGGYGTLVIGTWWYPEMDNVDINGVIQEPSSLATPIGGHAYRVNWFDPKKKLYLIINSWGENWGVPKKGGSYTGYAYMTPALFERLLREEGEIAAATQVRLRAKAA
jgi:hypothetical protein